MACLLVPRRGSGQVPTRLVYVRSQGTSDCPGQSALEVAVAARLGYEAFSPWGEQTIIATISASNGRLLARAELVDRDGVAQGSRQVQARRSDCEELVATLALAISITLDPTHVAAPASMSSQSAAPSTSNRQPDSTSPPAPPEPAATAKSQTRADTAPDEIHAEPKSRTEAAALHAYAGAFAALALVPHATLGARIGAGFRRTRFSLWFGAEAALPRAEAAAGNGAVRIGLLASELALCSEVKAPFSLCSLTLLGSMRGEGEGVSAPKGESSFYASLGARGLLYLPLGSVFALLGNADLSTVLTRPTFQLDTADVWRPGALSFAAGLAISVHFL